MTSEQYIRRVALITARASGDACTTSALIYRIDGCALNIPTAQNIWPYTSWHWLPVALDIKAKPKSGELK